LDGGIGVFKQTPNNVTFRKTAEDSGKKLLNNWFIYFFWHGDCTARTRGG